jgi:hypothetical protein
MAPRSVAWSTAVRRDWRLTKRICRSTWSGGARHLAVHQSAPRTGYRAHPVGRVRGQDHGHAHRSVGGERRISVRATTRRSRIAFGRGTPTIPISKNTAFAITGAAAVPRRARPSCGWRPAPSRANFCRSGLNIKISGYLAQMGPLVLEPVDPPTAYDNPFFCPDPSRIKELEDSSGACARRATPSARASR